jgi:hypothetical protein
MHRLKVEAEITVFLLFFGTAMVDALRHHRWPLSAVYILLALMFLFSGQTNRPRGSRARADFAYFVGSLARRF